MSTRTSTAIAVVTATLAAAGCWHVPTANIQPSGPPRLIEAAIVVESPRQELTVFVSTDRTLQLPGGRIVSAARVLQVDPSYRVLTLEFPDGRREVFKVNRGVKLEEIEPGDDVAIRPSAR